MCSHFEWHSPSAVQREIGALRKSTENVSHGCVERYSSLLCVILCVLLTVHYFVKYIIKILKDISKYCREKCRLYCTIFCLDVDIAQAYSSVYEAAHNGPENTRCSGSGRGQLRALNRADDGCC